MKKSNIILVLLICFVFFAGLSVGVQAEEQKKADSELSVEEQNRLALEAYENILELSGSDARQNILPQLEASYYNVISRFPKASLAQESYWRLMQIYFNDYKPPLTEKAESLRTEFIKKYPGSKVKGIMDRALVDGYIKHGKWDKVISFFTPAIKQAIETGKFDSLYDIYMYTEAKYFIGDFAEAEKGYKIIIANFPTSRESAAAKKKIEEIQKKRPN